MDMCLQFSDYDDKKEREELENFEYIITIISVRNPLDSVSHVTTKIK